MSYDYRELKERLESSEKANALFRTELQRRDVAEFKAKQAEADRQQTDSIMLTTLTMAQDSAERELSSPDFIEDHRRTAWYDAFPGKLWDWPKAYYEKGWPDGVTAESYIRMTYGLTADGDALMGKPLEPNTDRVPSLLRDIAEGTPARGDQVVAVVRGRDK
jgi:hypothetical protein